MTFDAGGARMPSFGEALDLAREKIGV